MSPLTWECQHSLNPRELIPLTEKAPTVGCLLRCNRDFETDLHGEGASLRDQAVGFNNVTILPIFEVI